MREFLFQKSTFFEKTVGAFDRLEFSREPRKEEVKALVKREIQHRVAMRQNELSGITDPKQLYPTCAQMDAVYISEKKVNKEYAIYKQQQADDFIAFMDSLQLFAQNVFYSALLKLEKVETMDTAKLMEYRRKHPVECDYAIFAFQGVIKEYMEFKRYDAEIFFK